MPRLKIGDHVRILAEDASPFASLEAVVREVHEHDRGVAVLDRYVVVFEWGEEQTFYDAQIEQISRISNEKV